MVRFLFLAGACGAVIVLADPAAAAEGFDNPTQDGAPCVFLNRFEVEAIRGATNGELYDGSAEIENVCARALEVQFCFEYAPNEEGVAGQCYDRTLRPWGRSELVNSAAPARITRPSYEWRYAP